MGEVVNVVVAFAVIVFIVRWMTAGGSEPAAPGQRTPSDVLGFRPKAVTQDMVDAVANVFPDIPVDNIRYDLLRTGSVERTTNKILESSFLPAPPPSYFTLYPRQETPTQTAAPPAPSSTASTTARLEPRDNLITRFHLEDRVNTSVHVVPEAGGKAKWENTPEEREASLKERKAQMILAARQYVIIPLYRRFIRTAARY
ncbi:hypothetical protein FISHEDRAFT_35833 [Fistulina hepatica ATCC 64428]|uniref:CUE domain-containing protein n=1 Tax=Fistulina hepatica ATCC 64428 TaxID=1128425 RepID=A0A0D7ALK9_9AGAR|nr:hypothetical protein FISHEDRAFT_35833 [Fistulina hepatica ATCC 64428]